MAGIDDTIGGGGVLVEAQPARAEELVRAPASWGVDLDGLVPFVDSPGHWACEL